MIADLRYQTFIPIQKYLLATTLTTYLKRSDLIGKAVFSLYLITGSQIVLVAACAFKAGLHTVPSG